MASNTRTIAFIDPLGDFGIGGYTYELAEGMAANGVEVDLYTCNRPATRTLPRNHRLLCVLGGVLIKQRHLLNGATPSLEAPVGASLPAGGAGETASRSGRLHDLIWGSLLPLELALHLKRSRYDVIWTQWPDMGPYGTRFWFLCKALGMRMVHTVHNVLPHEESSLDREVCRSVYRYSDRLIVHSHFSREELLSQFPEVAGKVVVAPLGAYTMYPRRPESRGRVREKLGLREDQVALLFYGGVRPYKNVEAVLGSLKDPRCRRAVLVVAGRESGYPEQVPGDALGRTRKLVEEMGLSERVRLIAGHLSLEETAELFEACDVVTLPYIKSYGSGLLLLAMTYGKHILATASGGMDEYLRHYPSHTLLEGPDADQVARGVAKALASGSLARTTADLSHLEWPRIARQTLQELRDPTAIELTAPRAAL